MAISIKCAACGKRYQAADHMAGRRVRCKHCGTTFQLPAEPTSDEPFISFREDAEPSAAPAMRASPILDEDDAPLAPAPPPPQQQPAPRALPPRQPEPGDPFNDPAFDPSADVDAAFDEAFQEYTPSRGNTPFVFPGSRQLDRYLPTALVVICVAWLAYLTLRTGAGEPTWVGPVRLLLILMTFAGVVFPACLKGARMGARKLNYELPSGAPWRAFATFLLPVTIGCALWLSSGSVAGFIFGVAMGLIVALPVMWLLFRIRPDDAPVSLGYGAGAFGVSVLGSAVILSVLNLILVGTVRGTNSKHSLAVSPFGPGFAWDGPTVVEKPVRRPAPRPRVAQRGEPEEPTTKAFSEGSTPPPPAAGPTDLAAGATQPAATLVVAAPPLTDPAAIRAAEAEAAKAAQPAADPVPAPDGVKPAVYGPVVAEVFPRMTTKQATIVHPLLPGKGVAVVKPGARADEDTIELWSTTDWQAKRAVSFARAAGTDLYQLSSDGTLLGRLADFPYASAQVYSFRHEALLRPFIKLDPGGPAPHLAGFCAPDQLMIIYAAGKAATVDVWDVNKITRLRRIPVPGLQADPRGYTLSRDGKLLAAVVRDDWSGELSGRLEVYKLATGERVRQIKIDELQWTHEVQPSGVAFTEESDKLAVLFVRRGQGIFLCWGADDTIPIHTHIYPGGLLPEGVNVGGFRGPSFSLVDNGRAWLFYGASVFDTASGKLLGDLLIKNVAAQKVVSRDTVLLVQQPIPDGQGDEAAVLEVRLDVNRARRQVVAGP